MTDRPPIYDGVGPRTSATGTGSGPVGINELNQPKRSSSLKRFPTSISQPQQPPTASSTGDTTMTAALQQSGSNKSRDSSGSEVTLGKLLFSPLDDLE